MREKRVRSRMNAPRLLAYAAAAGAALGAVGSAEASVVYSGANQNVSVQQGGSKTINFGTIGGTSFSAKFSIITQYPNAYYRYRKGSVANNNHVNIAGGVFS